MEDVLGVTYNVAILCKIIDFRMEHVKPNSAVYIKEVFKINSCVCKSLVKSFVKPPSIFTQKYTSLI